jgi:hypothetical protein
MSKRWTLKKVNVSESTKKHAVELIANSPDSKKRDTIRMLRQLARAGGHHKLAVVR